MLVKSDPTPLIRPNFHGPLVVVSTGFHCITTERVGRGRGVCMCVCAGGVGGGGGGKRKNLIQTSSSCSD